MVVPSIGSKDHRVVVGVEVFGLKFELFFSILEFEEEGYFMVSMGVTGIDEEPLSFITIKINMVLDILLQRLSLDIIRESMSIDVVRVHSDHQGSVSKSTLIS
jgi:hypothetical protein